MSETDRNVMAGNFVQLTITGYLDPAHQEDFNHVRSTTAIPDRKHVPTADDASKVAQLMGRYNHYARVPEVANSPGSPEPAAVQPE